MKIKLIALVVMASLAVLAQPYMIPTGTNTTTDWWISKPDTNRLSNWECWLTMNTNWNWAKSRMPTASLLRVAPYTVTNATDTTWTNGAGLICIDTNYVYISVGTNQWKRAALATW